MRHARPPASPRHRRSTCASRFASILSPSRPRARPCTFGRRAPAFTRISREPAATKSVSRAPGFSRCAAAQLAQTRELAGVHDGFVELVRYLHSREPCRDTPLRSSPWVHWPRCRRDGSPLHRNRRDRRPFRSPLARRIRRPCPRPSRGRPSRFGSSRFRWPTTAPASSSPARPGTRSTSARHGPRSTRRRVRARRSPRSPTRLRCVSWEPLPVPAK